MKILKIPIKVSEKVFLIFTILTLLMNRIIGELIEDNVLISHKISSRSNNRRIKRL